MKEVYRSKDKTPLGYHSPSSPGRSHFRTAAAAPTLRCSQNCVSSIVSSCPEESVAENSCSNEKCFMLFSTDRRNVAPLRLQDEEHMEPALPSSPPPLPSCLALAPRLPVSANPLKIEDYRKRHAVEGINRIKQQFADDDDDDFHPGGSQEVLRLSKAFHHRIPAPRPGLCHSPGHSEESTSPSVHSRFADVQGATTANSPQSISCHEDKANRYWNSPNSWNTKSSPEESTCAQSCRSNYHSCEEHSNTESASGSPKLTKQDSISNLNPGTRLHSAGFFRRPYMETPLNWTNFKENNLCKPSHDRSGTHFTPESMLIDEQAAPVSEEEGGEQGFQPLTLSKGDAQSHHKVRKPMKTLGQEFQKLCLKSELEGRIKLIQNDKAQVQNSLQKALPRGQAGRISTLESIRMESKKQKDQAREVAEKNSPSLSLKEGLSHTKFEDHCHSEQKMERKEDMKMVELKQVLSESLRQVKLVQEQRDALARRCQNQEGENMELQKTVSSLRQIFDTEDETVPYARLEGKSEQITKLQMETQRQRGIDVELLKGEVMRLRKENKSLVGRLKHASKGGIVRMLRVDEERTSRADAREESKWLSLKLREALRKMKENRVQMSDLDPQTEKALLKDHRHHVQQFLSKTDELKKSTHGFIGYKVNMVHGHPRLEFESQSENTFPQVKELVGLGNIHPNFKDETLFCKLLREKEVELEQLRGNFMSAVQDRDWLQMEVHSLQAALSSSNHRVQELEQQLLDREEETRGQLREMKNKSRQLMQMQEQVERVKIEMGREAEEKGKEIIKLSAEVEALKKKVEKLDEDVMLKDGQISILRSAFNDTDE